MLEEAKRRAEKHARRHVERENGEGARSVVFSTVFFVAVMLSGAVCTPNTYFTREIRQQYDLTPAQIKKIQFYIDPRLHGLLLGRDLPTAKQEQVTEKHGFKAVTEERKEIIEIKDGTPCVAVDVGKTWLRVACEAEGTLLFVEAEYLKNMYGTRYMVADENGRPAEEGGTVRYRGHRYEVAGLMVVYSALTSQAPGPSHQLQLVSFSASRSVGVR